MIKTEVIGCVGQDAVLREIAGYTYTCFDLAVKERVKGEERTTWVRIRKFDKEQKYAQYITKGKAIYVEGRPQVSAYTNKEGNPAADMTVWADRLEFIAGAGSGGSQQQTGYASSRRAMPRACSPRNRPQCSNSSITNRSRSPCPCRPSDRSRTTCRSKTV